MKTRLEFHDAASNSHRFYEFEVQGESISRRWGRVGTQGQPPKTEDCGSHEAALAEAQRLIKRQAGKGYEVVPGDDGTGAAKSDVLRGPTASQDSNRPSAQALREIRDCFAGGARVVEYVTEQIDAAEDLPPEQWVAPPIPRGEMSPRVAEGYQYYLDTIERRDLGTPQVCALATTDGHQFRVLLVTFDNPDQNIVEIYDQSGRPQLSGQTAGDSIVWDARFGEGREFARKMGTDEEGVTTPVPQPKVVSVRRKVVPARGRQIVSKPKEPSTNPSGGHAEPPKKTGGVRKTEKLMKPEASKLLLKSPEVRVSTEMPAEVQVEIAQAVELLAPMFREAFGEQASNARFVFYSAGKKNNLNYARWIVEGSSRGEPKYHIQINNLDNANMKKSAEAWVREVIFSALAYGAHESRTFGIDQLSGVMSKERALEVFEPARNGFLFPADWSANADYRDAIRVKYHR